MSASKDRRQRAAEYFGATRHPRVSVDVGNDQVLLVWRVGDQPLMALYREWGGGFASGMHVRLTDRRLQKIIEALQSEVLS